VAESIAMSRYNTVVLSFGYGEIDEPDDGESWSRDCEPLRQVNTWLTEQGCDPLEDLAGGWLGMNVCLFGCCGNRLEAEEFCEFVQGLNWRTIEDVRVLYWEEEAETFTMIEFPIKGRKRRPRNRR
jgi:hypothetical protein